ncbi:hypothetical protein ACVWYH_007218 [Bradyrhizobium sp. GM24.11]
MVQQAFWAFGRHADLEEGHYGYEPGEDHEPPAVRRWLGIMQTCRGRALSNGKLRSLGRAFAPSQAGGFLRNDDISRPIKCHHDCSYEVTSLLGRNH